MARYSLFVLKMPLNTNQLTSSKRCVFSQLREGILLGVMGTDVPITDFLDVIPQYKVTQLLTICARSHGRMQRKKSKVTLTLK